MQTMQAMVLDRPRTPLTLRERPLPAPGDGEIMVAVTACGVCRTDLHVVDGELPHPKLPIVPGHEIVGRVVALGRGQSGVVLGERVGIPWLRFDLWILSILQEWPGKPLRYPYIYGLHPRWGLCDTRGCRRTLLFSTGRAR